MKKKVLAVFLTVAILSSLLVAAASAVSVTDFTDVDTSSWYYEYVDSVTEHGYMVGVSATEFDPEGYMTRAMFVTVLSRVAGAEVDDSVSAFDDVPADTWYTGSVTWAAENGITVGDGEGNFMPDEYVTRQDMSTLMDRFVKFYQEDHDETHETVEEPAVFTDAELIDSYARDAVENCTVWGLIIGFEDGTFRPLDFSTRAQVATVITRLHWLVNSESEDEDITSGSSGSSGPSSPVEPTEPEYEHTVNVSIKVPSVSDSAFELEDVFNCDDGYDTVLTSLLDDDQIKNAVESLLDRVAGSADGEYEVTIDGTMYTLTVTVNEENITVKSNPELINAAETYVPAVVEKIKGVFEDHCPEEYREEYVEIVNKCLDSLVEAAEKCVVTVDENLSELTVTLDVESWLKFKDEIVEGVIKLQEELSGHNGFYEEFISTLYDFAGSHDFLTLEGSEDLIISLAETDEPFEILGDEDEYYFEIEINVEGFYKWLSEWLNGTVTLPDIDSLPGSSYLHDTITIGIACSVAEK